MLRAMMSLPVQRTKMHCLRSTSDLWAEVHLQIHVPNAHHTTKNGQSCYHISKTVSRMYGQVNMHEWRAFNPSKGIQQSKSEPSLKDNKLWV